MNQNTPIEERIANCKRLIERTNPSLEYVGGFKDVDSPVDVRCKACGFVFSRSMTTLRHPKKNTTCPVCKEAKKQQEKEQAKLEHLKIVEKNHRDRRAERMLAKSHSQSAMKICPICNSIFIGSRTYCSEHCANQNKWMMKDRYRYKFPLEELYQRDGSICYLCGKPCDLNDKQVVNGVTIYGNYYPSRDHVYPKSKGGENSWENLRLAHRICNSLKQDSPLVEKII